MAVVARGFGMVTNYVENAHCDAVLKRDIKFCALGVSIGLKHQQRKHVEMLNAYRLKFGIISESTAKLSTSFSETMAMS